ncbi:putative dimethylaniline protein [Daldinia childiae]|uniref:putative dimethylaniline protein n=1 Tax=Daldinia childiae TaxID=326645 RepID=UPI001446DA58|nr:putative dimethylaniline protein [Daldinia childiae]KAF3071070.1 putative dimethylaniline protein [Daldinia childiae]
MANGQSSVPNMPNFPGKEHFRGKVIHSVDFGQSDVVQDKSIQHIAVIGAGKSAADMVYEVVKAGKTVSWIIHETGNGSLGAAAFAPIDLPTPYKNGDANISNYNLAEKTAGGCHFADFWPLVAEKVYVYRGDVKLLDGNELYLNDKNGTHFPCDAVLCGTGWKSGLDMFENHTLMELGLPYPKDIEPQEVTAKWEKLVGKADEQVLRRFVMLRNPPKHYHK